MKTAPYFTKAQAIADFKANYLPAGYRTDKPMLRMCWNDYVNALHKSGSIRPSSDWTQPEFISR